MQIDNSANIDIYNLLGTTVYRSTNQNQENHIINLTEIQKGLYFLKVISDNEELTKKILVD